MREIREVDSGYHNAMIQQGYDTFDDSVILLRCCQSFASRTF